MLHATPKLKMFQARSHVSGLDHIHPCFTPLKHCGAVLSQASKANYAYPQVQGPQMGEQRLVYLENIVQESVNGLSDQLCSRAHQHTTAFHSKAMNLEDMSVGQ